MKFLEIPDLHSDVRWIDKTELVFDKIIETVKSEKIDYVIFPGDFHNRPIYATEQGGINDLRRLCKKLTDVVPACMIYGTPSHEAPGSLDIFEDSGIVILRPNKTYGLFDSVIKEMKTGDQDIIGLKCVIFGIPEINKKKIQSIYKLSAKKANHKATELFYKYVDDFIAPMRLRYQDVPAVCGFHGNVSDCEKSNETDIIKKSSDIVIHTEKLEHVGIDRWSLGHIHTPWESERIIAGYAGFTGFDDRPWNCLGFVPAMNMIEILSADKDYGIPKDEITQKFDIKLSRIPYGTPERRKILKPLKKYDPNIAYWLFTDDRNATLPKNVHPLSRTTYNIEKIKSKRVTKAEAENVKSLRDLFKLNDPKVSKNILEKVKSIEVQDHSNTMLKTETVVSEVEISGCILFGGDTVIFNIDDLNNGLTRINGGNGSGKSSLLAFCSQYPIVIGKDTLSGRQSAIKDFFSGDDCYIKKTVLHNEEVHEHFITIKNPDKPSSKTECFFNINKKPALVKGSFDEMLARCEEIYGSFNDYLLTTFYVQPQQGRTQSGLVDATMTEIRNLVQSIAGINREQEKRSALDKVSQLDKEIKKDESWLEGVNEFAIDIATLTSKTNDLIDQEKIINEDISNKELSKKTAQELTDQSFKLYTISQEQEKQQEQDSNKFFGLQLEKKSKENQLEKLTGLEDPKELRDIIKKDDEAIRSNNLVNEIINQNKQLENEYNMAVREEKNSVEMLNHKALSKYNDEVSRIKNDLNKLENEISIHNLKIEQLNRPCSNCGHIEDKKTLTEIENKRQTALNFKKELEFMLKNLVMPSPVAPNSIDHPTYKPVGQLKKTLPDHERTTMLSKISQAEESSNLISDLKKEISIIESQLKELNEKKYSIDSEAEPKYIEAKKYLDEIIQEITNLKSSRSAIYAEIDGINKQIEDGKTVQDKIKATREKTEKNKSDLEDWKYIDTMLSPSKIPALELELVVDLIDDEATRIIYPLLDGQFSFDTRTQIEGKKATVDKFDILVHNNETGISKSFVQHSPGEKAFFADAYTKALVKQRNQRCKRTYQPIILDESDGPIDPERIQAFYEIQKSYWSESKVIIVSHTPVSHEYIENTVNMEDLK